MENIVFDMEEVFQEVRNRMQTQGAYTREEYIDLVDEVLEEKREEGLVDDDENFKQAHEALENRWSEVAEAELSTKTDTDEIA